MGKSHVVVGATGWLAAANAAAPLAGVELSTAALACGTVVAAGAALLPDIDHPNSTIALSLGPVSNAVAKVVGPLSGGHRMATHSLLFCAFAGLGTAALVLTAHGRWIAYAIAFFLVSLTIRVTAFGKKHGGSHGLLGAGVAVQAAALVAVGAHFVGDDLNWFGFAVGSGALLHLAGDVITPAGVPLFWPSKTRFRFPVLPATGGGPETVLAGAVAAIGVVLAVHAFGPEWASPTNLWT